MTGTRRRTGAFTLLEVLIALVIIAAASGLILGLTPLLRRHDDEAMPRLREAGAWLRLSGASERVRLTPSGWTHLDLSRRHDDVVIDGVALHWTDAEGRPVDRLELDRHGRSHDVRLRIDRGAERTQWRWLGISGQWIAEDPPR